MAPLGRLYNLVCWVLGYTKNGWLQWTVVAAAYIAAATYNSVFNGSASVYAFFNSLFYVQGFHLHIWMKFYTYGGHLTVAMKPHTRNLRDLEHLGKLFRYGTWTALLVAVSCFCVGDLNLLLRDYDLGTSFAVMWSMFYFLWTLLICCSFCTYTCACLLARRRVHHYRDAVYATFRCHVHPEVAVPEDVTVPLIGKDRERALSLAVSKNYEPPASAAVVKQSTVTPNDSNGTQLARAPSNKASPDGVELVRATQACAAEWWALRRELLLYAKPLDWLILPQLVLSALTFTYIVVVIPTAPITQASYLLIPVAIMEYAVMAFTLFPAAMISASASRLTEKLVAIRTRLSLPLSDATVSVKNGVESLVSCMQASPAGCYVFGGRTLLTMSLSQRVLVALLAALSAVLSASSNDPGKA